MSKRALTTPFMNELELVGRMDENEELRPMLLSNDHDNIGVVVIFGMGGW